MFSRWKIEDILDLDFFIERDRETAAREGESALKKRDREICIKALGDRPEHDPRHSDAHFLLRLWLFAMRRGWQETHPGAMLPGAVWIETFSLLEWLAAFAGLFSGAALAFSLLAYSGTRPVNVLLLTGILLIPQLLILACTLAAMLFRRSCRMPAALSAATRLCMRLFRFIARRLADSSDLANGVEDSFDTAAANSSYSGMASRLAGIHGKIIILPFFILIQLYGICFNIGALAAIILKVTVTDVAFGWESTLRIGPEMLYGIVKAVAAPWAWFMPEGIGMPGLEQIAGSRMVLKEGMHDLATANLVSWWPFICMCLLFYALIPRIVLFISGKIMLARKLRDFDHNIPEFRKIIDRMTLPDVKTAGREPSCHPGTMSAASPGEPLRNKDSRTSLSHENSPEGEAATTSPAEHLSSAPLEMDANEPARHASDKAEATFLVPEEIMDSVPEEELSRLAARLTGSEFFKSRPFEPGELPEEKETGRGAADSGIACGRQHQGQVFILQEAWQPPIEEDLLFLEKFANLAQKTSGITVILVGKPSGNRFITSPDEQQAEVWELRLAALGNEGIKTLRLESFQ